MADDNNNQNKGNDQQNQGKNKGGGGGGNGLSCSGKFDATNMGSLDAIKTQALGHVANSVGFIGGMFLAAAVFELLRNAFNVKPAAAPAQGGGGGPLNPGQLTGGLFNLKKSDPAKFDEIMAKVNPPAA